MTPSYQHINPAVLLDAAGQDVQAFLELSATFLDIAPPMYERLRHAITASQAADITLQSHSLKGTVALIGADQLASMLGRIEALSRKASLEEIHPLWADLAEAYKETIAEVHLSIRHFQESTACSEDSRDG
ncbi:Hpt domain-containing protein [Herbaspirillum rhizosphaerae]|uniref:Hpt domain-containing protein n=1 Tax=Herbaspirillum rhizosphaerae TaxID=346179 RepID=A0ABW8ZBT8_9BURK